MSVGQLLVQRPTARPGKFEYLALAPNLLVEAAHLRTDDIRTVVEGSRGAGQAQLCATLGI